MKPYLKYVREILGHERDNVKCFLGSDRLLRSESILYGLSDKKVFVAINWTTEYKCKNVMCSAENIHIDHYFRTCFEI